MHVDLKTTISAYLAAAPIALDNYYTKDEVYSKKEIDLKLEEFVREVPDGDPAIIYGRQNGEWVPIIKTPENINGMLIYGFSTSETLDEEALLKIPGRQGLIDGVKEYLIESKPSVNSYLWFCCTQKIIDEEDPSHIYSGIQANNGLNYPQEVYPQPEKVSLVVTGKTLEFYCYRTPKLAALPGVVYKYKVKIK